MFIDVDSMVNKDQPFTLSSGEKIFFQFVNAKDNSLENPQIRQIYIITLRTEAQSVITTESYALKDKNSTQTIKNVYILTSY